MLIIGLLLILVGAAVLYLVGDRFAHFAGIVLIVLGLILVLLGVLDVSDINTKNH